MQRAFERVQQHVARFAGIDELVEPKGRRGTVRRLDLGPPQGGRLLFGRLGGRGHGAEAPIAPIVAPGNANVADWLIETDQRHHHRAEAVRLAQRQVNFRHPAPVCAANIRAPLRSTPRPLGRGPGQHARVVREKEQREVKRVGDRDEMRRLVGGVGVDAAREVLRLVGDHRHGRATEPCQPADDRLPKPGWISKSAAAVENHVEHPAHVVHLPVVARHDAEDFRDLPPALWHQR